MERHNICNEPEPEAWDVFRIMSRTGFVECLLWAGYRRERVPCGSSHICKSGEYSQPILPGSE